VTRLVRPVLVVLFAATSLSAAPRLDSGQAQGTQTFTGVITDSECAEAGHARMRMGPTDPECVIACIHAHGAAYVLYDGKNVYVLSDQKTPEQFAAQKVRVTGTLDTKAKTIRVESIRAEP
jgi:hypothetical protein